MSIVGVRKIKYVTDYGPISGIYFRKILSTIVQVGELERSGLRVLDFGCGHGVLKKMNPQINITGYDIVRELTEVDAWNLVAFEVVVSSETFCLFNAEQLERLLCEFKSHNKNMELVVGISRQSFINKVGSVLLGHGNAHDGTKLKPAEEKNVLLRLMEIIGQRTVWGLADVYRFKFK